MQNGSAEKLAIIPVDPYLPEGPPSLTQWTGSTTGIARQLRELADSLDKKELATMLLLKKYDDAVPKAATVIEPPVPLYKPQQSVGNGIILQSYEAGDSFNYLIELAPFNGTKIYLLPEITISSQVDQPNPTFG